MQGNVRRKARAPMATTIVSQPPTRAPEFAVEEDAALAVSIVVLDLDRYWRISGDMKRCLE